ncbi:unnamed protein product [Withania somnifera]
MAMENYLLIIVILIAPAFILLRSSMAKQPNNPPLMNVVRETNLMDLPFDIIINILNKLSMKSLFHFRYVCKSWHSLLSTREIAIHFNHVSHKKFTLLRNVDVRSPWYNGIARFKIPFELKSLEFMLLEPVHGILCIIEPIWSHLLPKPNVRMGYFAVSFGFGFVSNTNDYKVVRVIRHQRKDDSCVEIYSLNRGSWRRVKDPRSQCRSPSSEDRFHGSAVRTVDLEKEEIVESDYRKSKQFRTAAWSDKGDAILLTLLEDDLVLCHGEYGKSDPYSYRSSSRFDFSPSLVSPYRGHNDLS